MLETLLHWSFNLQLYGEWGNRHGGKTSSPTGKHSSVWKLYFELSWGTCKYFELIAVAWMLKNPDQQDLQWRRICCNSLHVFFEEVLWNHSASSVWNLDYAQCILKDYVNEAMQNYQHVVYIAVFSPISKDT